MVKVCLAVVCVEAGFSQIWSHIYIYIYLYTVFIQIEAWASIFNDFWPRASMSPASIQTPAFIFYCSPVQGRIAGASTSVYEFDNVVRGQHVYKSAWTPLTDTENT